jgi:hypothetical protein
MQRSRAIIRCCDRLSNAALYWHVRRYSCSSTQESYAIYIATLVLWASCISMQLPEVAEATANDGKTTPDTSFCHLNQPMDDELVQLFVRVGHMMGPNVSKVGNILDPYAAPQILREGRGLLLGWACSVANTGSTSSQFTWGLERCYAESLEGLLEAMSCPPITDAEYDAEIFPWGLCSPRAQVASGTDLPIRSSQSR